MYIRLSVGRSVGELLFVPILLLLVRCRFARACVFAIGFFYVRACDGNNYLK